jgi:hypothetical protein
VAAISFESPVTPARTVRVFRLTLPMNALSGYRLVQAVFDGREIGTTGIRIVGGDHQLIFYLAPR